MKITHANQAEAGDVTAVHAPRTPARTTAAALVAAGILFLLYPTVRPFSDESTMEGATAFASTSWLAAHTMGMAAFVLLTAGFLGLHLRREGTPTGGRSLRALVLSWIGVGLTLPFYGAETFGLAAIGQGAIDRSDPSLISLVESVQMGPGIGFLIVGLVVLAAGAVLNARLTWRSSGRRRWSAIPLAAGLVLYLPQFVMPQPFRIAHGVLMLVGCVLLARDFMVIPQTGGAVAAAVCQPGAERTRSRALHVRRAPKNWPAGHSGYMNVSMR